MPHRISVSKMPQIHHLLLRVSACPASQPDARSSVCCALLFNLPAPHPLSTRSPRCSPPLLRPVCPLRLRRTQGIRGRRDRQTCANHRPPTRACVTGRASRGVRWGGSLLSGVRSGNDPGNHHCGGPQISPTDCLSAHWTGVRCIPCRFSLITLYMHGMPDFLCPPHPPYTLIP